jgi:ribonuclease HII
MPDSSREERLRGQGYLRVAGVDEAGRGPLAGPLVVAAVVLPVPWPGPQALEDSKRLGPIAREAAFLAVRRQALSWKVRVVSWEVIDRINILQATLAGMAAAVEALRPPPDFVLVDGNRVPGLGVPCEAVVGGDGRCNCIAAASILAKVVRDRLMRVYGRRYPQWGFAQHKGYATRAHREALARYGSSPIHRASFRLKEGAWQGTPPSDDWANPSLPGTWNG